MTTPYRLPAAWPASSGRLFLAALGLAWMLTCPRVDAADTVPAPLQVLQPSLESAFYFDLAAARQTGAWRDLARQLETISNQMEAAASRQQAVPGFLAFTTAIEGLQQDSLGFLKGLEIAEIAVASEGGAGAAQIAQLGENASFLAALRFSKTVEDQEALIGQILALVEQESPGTSSAVAATRSRVGGAELFELPKDALPDLPFPISVGVGPGEGGTTVIAGRTDQLKRFLEAPAGGGLPAKVSSLLSQRGQLWVYAALPEGSAKAMADATAGLPGQGLPPQVLETVDQLREFGLSLDFGPSAIDLTALLGCASGEVAGQMAQQVQGFTGMMQMMAGQQPAGLPPFLSQLRASAQGKVFRLTTSFSARDLEVAWRTANAGGALASGGRGAPPTGALPEVVPLEAPQSAPVEISFLSLLPNSGGHVRRARLQLRNVSDRDVRELRVTYRYQTGSGATIGEWTRIERDPYTDILVRASQTRRMEVNLFQAPARTETVSVRVLEAVFADGEKWSLRP